MNKIILTLIALSVFSMAAADLKFLETTPNLKFPDIPGIIKCIEAAVAEESSIASTFQSIINDLNNGNFIQALMELKNLTGPAKAIWDACKSLTVKAVQGQEEKPMLMSKRPNLRFDFDKIVKCIEGAIAQVPEVAKDFEVIINFIKEKQWFQALLAAKDLAGPALAIFKGCA